MNKETGSESAKKAPKIDETTPAADDTTPTEKAPEKQEEKPLQGEEEKQGEKQAEKQATEKQGTEPEKRVKIAPTGSASPLATVPEPEPENRSAAADQNDRTDAEPSRADEPSAAEPKKSGWEVGTYTTKKGKVKTAIKFNVTPRPEWIEALKKAFYWEYNGTWNGSPRKLPEIFKH